MAMVPMIGDPLAQSGPRRGTTATAVGVAFALFVLIEIPCAALVYWVSRYSTTWAVVVGILVFLVGNLIAAGVRIAQEWERIAVLRLGRFQRMAGPGFFWIVPVVDTTPYLVDLRIVTYDVPEQRALSKENIPVTVDAIVYYRVADAEAAVLKVENYMMATQLGAQTMLRDLVGKSLLDELLQERERLSEMMKVSLDELTDAWGVKVPNVEIKQVIVADKLEDAIAREPAAEREKRARLKLAEAEKLAAQTFFDAAQIYEQDPVALQLRSMNMLYEMCMEGSATVVFVPTETKLGMPTPVGVQAITEQLQSLEAGGRPKRPDKAPES